MKLYGHIWSTNTRKTLATLAEKKQEAEFRPLALPKGEHRSPEHLALHPFAKVPVLEDGDFVLYETRAINAYLDKTLPGPSLVPTNARELARMDQWTNVADAYFVPFVMPVIMELLFRPYLGGERNDEAVAAGREGMQPALDQLDRALAKSEYVAGTSFSLGDIHWMPYVEYLVHIGDAESIAGRKHLAAWWERVSARDSWRKVARTGPQPYEKAA
jgi:glutathione S-transferase